MTTWADLDALGEKTLGSADSKLDIIGSSCALLLRQIQEFAATGKPGIAASNPQSSKIFDKYWKYCALNQLENSQGLPCLVQ